MLHWCVEVFPLLYYVISEYLSVLKMETSSVHLFIPFGFSDQG
jgi:hypothetical protein